VGEGFESLRNLTVIERRVLELLAEGADGRTIASDLRISRNQVKAHTNSILTKLNVHSRLEAITTYGLHRQHSASGTPRPIRVVIVDDHELFAEAIREALEDAGIDVAAVLRNGRDALSYVLEDRPDVVLLDLGLPDMSGLALGREILDSWPEAKLVALTALDDPRAIQGSTAVGFRGYLMKDTPVSSFIASVEAVASGETVFPQVSTSESSEWEPDPLDELTELEWKTIGLLAEGVDEVTIASTLGLPPDSVGEHLSRLLDKLGIPERADEALRRLGWEPTMGGHHPHPNPMDDAQLLVHVRFMHARGIPQYGSVDAEELRRLHDLMHGGTAPSPA
jgi:DNA-binding NarL/FixJ family response regulator